MNKRATKKAAYKAIVKENKSHQTTFDELRPVSEMTRTDLANEVSSIPSLAKFNELKNLRITYIVLLGVIVILRILGGLGLSEGMTINPILLMVAILISLLVPFVGIFGDLTRRYGSYRFVGILLIIGVVRSINPELFNDTLNLIFLIPFLAVIGLAFYIPAKLKTSYTSKVNKEEKDGKVITQTNIVFEEETQLNDSELLDDSFVI
ncbi:hypothetical protein DNU06_08090 [Putridiphycobacter roseus]|uniref:Uncharacterized protein n=1 Tax=Putridiphycobacter roseus TaxID=2219161 RepID=A0A2W1N0G8_9FLAO|nr:hypothetical protein [Putridiphycobacter roseus]PZE17224.1 hypothetical protein DNU06_08090 [Putridiphycobacter roseus]